MPCDRMSGKKSVVTGGALPTTRCQVRRPYTGARPSMTDRAADETRVETAPLPALWLPIYVAGMSVVRSSDVLYCLIAAGRAAVRRVATVRLLYRSPAAVGSAQRVGEQVPVGLPLAPSPRPPRFIASPQGSRSSQQRCVALRASSAGYDYSGRCQLQTAVVDQNIGDDSCGETVNRRRDLSALRGKLSSFGVRRINNDWALQVASLSCSYYYRRDGTQLCADSCIIQ